MRNISIALVASVLLSLPVSAADRPDNDSTLTVVLTGDILLDRGVRKAIEHHGVDHLFSDGVDSVFHAAQVVVGNLECPATAIEAPVFKKFIFRAEPSWLEALQRHGVTHLNLANNHSIDQGRRGLIDTKENILAAGMVPIGAGANMAEASEPVLLAEQPRKVWLVPSLRLALENYAYLTDKPQTTPGCPLADSGRCRRARLPSYPHPADHRGLSRSHDLLQRGQLHLRPAQALK